MTEHPASARPWRVGALLATLVLGAALSACGRPAVRNVLAGLTPAKAVANAVAGLGTSSFRLQATQTIEMDASGMPASALGGGQSVVDVHQTMSGDVQSPQRFSGVLTSGQHTPVRIVFYDGTAYVSPDGTTWKQAPFLSQLYQQFGIQHIQDLTRQTTAVHDRGAVRTAGVDAERYDATLSPAYITTVTQQVAASMASSFGVPAALMSRAMTAMTIDSFTLQFDVARATGRLLSTSSSGQISVDLAKMATALGAPARPGLAGVMRIHVDSVQRTSDQGAHIVIPHPTSSGTMTLQELGSLLTSGAVG